MHLLAPTVVRCAPGDFKGTVRSRFGSELRRAGDFAQLCLLGAESCMDEAGGVGSLAFLCASRLGATGAIRAALGEDLERGEPVMPFTFIGMQPHLSGALLAQRGRRVTRAVHLHLSPESWPLLLYCAKSWLADCDDILLGWVDESDSVDVAHRSDWCLLRGAASKGAIACAPTARDSDPAGAEDWIERVAAWRKDPGNPLALRGGADAWLFSMPERE